MLPTLLKMLPTIAKLDISFDTKRYHVEYGLQWNNKLQMKYMKGTINIQINTNDAGYINHCFMMVHYVFDLY